MATPEADTGSQSFGHFLSWTPWFSSSGKRKVTSEQGGTSLQHDPECGGAMVVWHFRLKTLLVSTWKMDTGGQLASLFSGGVQTQS